MQTEVSVTPSAVLTGESSPMSSQSRVRLAYLLSRYPAVSHTFLLNEVRTLRNLNFEIATASINSCDRLLSVLGGVERLEEEATFYVKKAGVWRALWAFANTLVHRPLGLLRGLFFVIR